MRHLIIAALCLATSASLFYGNGGSILLPSPAAVVGAHAQQFQFDPASVAAFAAGMGVGGGFGAGGAASTTTGGGTSAADGSAAASTGSELATGEQRPDSPDAFLNDLLDGFGLGATTGGGGGMGAPNTGINAAFMNKKLDNGMSIGDAAKIYAAQISQTMAKLQKEQAAAAAAAAAANGGDSAAAPDPSSLSGAASSAAAPAKDNASANTIRIVRPAPPPLKPLEDQKYVVPAMPMPSNTANTEEVVDEEGRVTVGPPEIFAPTASSVAEAARWVGDGFRLRKMFGYESPFSGPNAGEEEAAAAMGSVSSARSRSPFLLLDYAEEMYFAPMEGYLRSLPAGTTEEDFATAIGTGRRRGLGGYPHQGYEVITIGYEGEVEYAPYKGARNDKAGEFAASDAAAAPEEVSVVGPGDCQWATAAGRGLQRTAYHSHNMSKYGGYLSFAQLWVNIPTKHKQHDRNIASATTATNTDDAAEAAPFYGEPRHRMIPNSTIAVVPLYAETVAATATNGDLSVATRQFVDGGAYTLSPMGHARLIAGSMLDAGSGSVLSGPARTLTPMNIWDLRFKQPVAKTKKELRRAAKKERAAMEAAMAADEDDFAPPPHIPTSPYPSVDLPQPSGWTTMMAVLKGRVMVNGEHILGANEVIHLSDDGSEVRITPLPLTPAEAAEARRMKQEKCEVLGSCGHTDAASTEEKEKTSSSEGEEGATVSYVEADGEADEYKVLFLSGEPIDAPIYGKGPFVMATEEAATQAAEDYRTNRF